MKYFGFLMLLGAMWSCSGKIEEPINSKSNVENLDAPIKYDSVLASEFEADDYGMKPYVIAFLKEGANRDVDSLTAQEIFMAHMKNINRMTENGDLVLAGPFLGKDDLRGLYIFNVKTIEEAEALTNTDPAIQSGYLVMELREWHGSAGLMGLNELHAKVQKQGVLD
jgi:uncharacterized protein YciI